MCVQARRIVNSTREMLASRASMTRSGASEERTLPRELVLQHQSFDNTALLHKTTTLHSDVSNALFVKLHLNT